MPIWPLKKLPLPDAAEALNRRWLGELEEQIGAANADWYRLARDTLFQLWYPGHNDYNGLLADAGTSLASRTTLTALDPHNITLEPEYYADVDAEAFARVKPLLWLWYGFDRTPLAGQNVDLGVKFRRVLAQRIFKRCGKDFKCFQNVEFSYGYNLEVGDDVVVHRNVLLDDRGRITLGDRVSISDFANIYSHTHSIVDQKDVTNAHTVLENDVRITYHATVLAGVRVHENGMVGAHAVATKDVKPYHVNVGIPAKSIRVKPNAPTHAYVTERIARREPSGPNEAGPSPDP